MYQIRKIRTKIKSILNDIDEFSKQINNEIESSQLRVNKIGKFEGDFKLINYNQYIK